MFMILQQDIIKLNGQKIFINPFLYSNKFDKKTKKWLIESGQISKSRIELNRDKFYPGLDWEILSVNEKHIKDNTVELLLKTMDIIQAFNPNLSYEKLLEVERQLIYYKKVGFEIRSKKYIEKRNRLLLKNKRRLQRDDFILRWQNWFCLKETRKLLMPIFVIILMSTFIGWFAGISKNSCNPYFERNSSYQK